MKTSDEFVIYRISFKKVNEYLGQKIHLVNEFDFFPNLMTEQSVSLSYAYLIHAKKVQRFTVRRPHKRRTGLVTSLIIRGSLFDTY